MRPSKNIVKLIRILRVTPSAEMYESTLRDALEAQEKSKKIRPAHAQANIRTIIVKSPITKLAAAAVILIGVFVCIYRDGGGIESIALAEVIEKTQRMPWMKVKVTVTEEPGVEKEVYHQWYDFGSKKIFTKCASYVRLSDLAEEKDYFYRFSDNTLMVKKLTERFFWANSSLGYVGKLVEAFEADGWRLTQRRDKVGKVDVEVFELSQPLPWDSPTIIASDGTKVSKETIELVADLRSKLLITINSKWLSDKDVILRYSEEQISYPESGPKDIYALGVPPIAKLPTAYASDKLYEELNEVRQMGAAGDVDGLVAILLQGQFKESKVAAANYLAKIGDLSAVGPLEKLAEEWEGDPADNPFAAAVSEIIKRFEEEDTEDTTQITTAEKTITCSGIVLDPNDNPIEGVDVRAELYYNGCYTDWRIFAETTAKTRTDKSGQFKLSTPSAKYGMHYILVFEHPEYPTAWYHGTGGYLRIHMLGAEPSFVAGQVIDEDGNVIEGAAVQALAKWHPSYRVGGRGSTVITYTDSEGWFLFDKIYEGARLHIDAWKEGYLRYSTESIGRDTYPVRAGMDYLLFTLEPGGTIIGHLTFEGEPYRREGVLVVARRTGSGANGQAVTDKKGEFRISGLDPKRRYTLTINERFFAGTGLICKPAENIQVGAGEKSRIAVELQAGVPVTFRIIDSNTGQAVYDQPFSVVLWDPNYRETRKPVNIRVASGRTDASGRSVLMLTPNDSYQLHTNEWDAQSEREVRLSKDFNVGADVNEVSVEVHITPCPRLYGRLVDTEGKPVEGQVKVFGESAISNVAGEFALRCTHQTYLDRAGYAFDKDKRSGRAFFCREVIDTNQTEIVLEPLVDIVGRVIDPNGEGLTDALPKVGILRSNGRWYRERIAWWKTVVDKDGYFRIKGVPVGVPMVVSVTPPGAEPDVILGPLQPGEEIDVGHIVVKVEVLERLREPADAEWNGTLSGLITDEYGDPVMGTLVETRIGRRYFRDYTDIDGRYRLTGLPRGEKLKLNIGHRYAPTSYDVICDGNDFDVQLLPKERK